MISSQIGLLASIFIYMFFMLGVGFWASTKISETKDYIIAGGKLGVWLSFGTIFATWFGAETCMGSSRTAYEQGFPGVIADPFGAGLCLILAGLFFVKIFHRLKIETVIDFFEMRYGRKVALVLSFLYIPVYLGWIGGQLLAFGLILNALTGLPVMLSIIISTAVVLLYTYWGGMWADAVTDLFQMFFIVLGLLVLFPIVMKDAGGLAGLKAAVPEEFFHFRPHSTSATDWLNYAQAWMIVGLGSLPAQDLIQRMLSPKSETIAKWCTLSAGLFYIVIGLVPVLLGIAGRVVLPGNNGDSILIHLASKYLSLPLMTLLIGALLSAIMSSADSALIAPAGIIGHNIVSFINPKAPEHLKLQVCKWSIPAVGILSLMMALYFQNVYELCTNAWGILLVGVAAPLIFGIYWKKANAAGAWAGVLGGTGAWTLLSLVLPEDAPCQLYGFLVSCVSLIIFSLLTRAHGSPAPSAGFNSR